VLSILWALGAWLYVENAAVNAARDAKTVYTDLCTRHKEENNDFDVKPCFDQGHDIYQTTFGDWSAWAWPVALVPIPIVWLLVYIVVWTVRWIRRGFQPST
jgi:hypothetical protein